MAFRQQHRARGAVGPQSLLKADLVLVRRADHGPERPAQGVPHRLTLLDDAVVQLRRLLGAEPRPKLLLPREPGLAARRLRDVLALPRCAKVDERLLLGLAQSQERLPVPDPPLGHHAGEALRLLLANLTFQVLVGSG